MRFMTCLFVRTIDLSSKYTTHVLEPANYLSRIGAHPMMKNSQMYTPQKYVIVRVYRHGVCFERSNH